MLVPDVSYRQRELPARQVSGTSDASKTQLGLIGTWKRHPTVLWPELRSRKNAVKSPAMAAGSSTGAKCPPRGKTVQRWMLYTRSRYERGGSPSETVWCAKTPNAVGVPTYVGSTGYQRLSQ